MFYYIKNNIVWTTLIGCEKWDHTVVTAGYNEIGSACGVYKVRATGGYPWINMFHVTVLQIWVYWAKMAIYEDH